MKDSSDIALEVADISLLSSSLNKLVVLRELSCAVLEKYVSARRCLPPVRLPQ